MFKKIVVATDGSELSLSAARKGMELAKLFHARLEVIYVIDQRVFFFPHEVQILAPENPYFKILDELRRNAEAILDKLEKVAQKVGVEIERFVLEGAVVDEINRRVEEAKADLLIIGAHGKTGEHRGVLGSTAQALVGSASCSIMIIRK